MSDRDREERKRTGIKALFQTVLNRHGHPFQYAVIRRANKLRDDKESFWNFEVSEFPVEVQGHNTKIDFILSHCPQHWTHGYLVAECKRTNTSISEWLFAKAPYVRRGRTSDTLNVERIKFADPDLLASVQTLPPLADLYHVALEAKIKLDPKGVSELVAADGRGAIENAATQVIRGLNGLIECASRKDETKKGFSNPAFFVPVIFTTARLWATDADIAEADLKSGNVDLANAKVERKPWLWLQYHMSPTLTHSVDREESSEGTFRRGTLGHLLKQEYSRTIAIVSTDGIDSFLRQSSSDWWD